MRWGANLIGRQGPGPPPAAVNTTSRRPAPPWPPRRCPARARRSPHWRFPPSAMAPSLSSTPITWRTWLARASKVPMPQRGPAAAAARRHQRLRPAARCSAWSVLTWKSSRRDAVAPPGHAPHGWSSPTGPAARPRGRQNQREGRSSPDLGLVALDLGSPCGLGAGSRPERDLRRPGCPGQQASTSSISGCGESTFTMAPRHGSRRQ